MVEQPNNVELVAMTMHSARQSGHLNPVLERLDRMIEAASRSVAIEGPEWPFKAAKRDGERAALAEFKTWIESFNSPEGA